MITINMRHICAEEFLDLNFNEAVIDKIYKFHIRTKIVILKVLTKS